MIHEVHQDQNKRCRPLCIFVDQICPAGSKVEPGRVQVRDP
jgi:hypothetical protein